MGIHHVLWPGRHKGTNFWTRRILGVSLAILVGVASPGAAGYFVAAAFAALATEEEAAKTVDEEGATETTPKIFRQRANFSKDRPACHHLATPLNPSRPWFLSQAQASSPGAAFVGAGIQIRC